MQDLYKYADLGRPLTKEEVDTNWSRIIDAVRNLEDGALPIRGVALIDDSTGQHLGFLDENGALLATVPFPAAVMQSGEWTSGAAYTTRSIVTNEGGTFLCASQHVAGEDFWTDFDDGKWIQLGAGGASAVIFQPGNTGMTSDTVQDAIVELHGLISGESLSAAVISFDRTSNDVGTGDVQSAIDELAQRLAATEGAVTDINATSVDFTPISGITATNVHGAISQLKDLIGSGGGSDDQTAAEVPFTPASGISATNVQSAIVEVKGLIGSGGTDDQTAAEVPFTPPSGMTSTNVQAAITEVKGLIPSSGGGAASGVSFNGTGLHFLSSTTEVQTALAVVDTTLDYLQDSITNFTVSASSVSYGGGSVATAIANLNNAMSSMAATGVAYGNHGVSTVKDAIDQLWNRVVALENAA